MSSMAGRWIRLVNVSSLGLETIVFEFTVSSTEERTRYLHHLGQYYEMMSVHSTVSLRQSAPRIASGFAVWRWQGCASIKLNLVLTYSNLDRLWLLCLCYKLTLFSLFSVHVFVQRVLCSLIPGEVHKMTVPCCVCWLGAVEYTFNLKMFLLLGVALDIPTNYANWKESVEVK